MSHDSPLVRQWILLRTLSSRHYGVTIQEMAQELGVTEKTIRRDLVTFQQMGFPLDETVGDHGRKSWRIQVTAGQPQMTFALDEALALYLGRRFLEPLAGTLFWEAAQSAFRKIRACLGKTAIEYLEKMGGALHHSSVGAGDYSKKADLIDQLMQGIEDRKATIIEYQSLQATEPVTYEVYPYGLMYHRGSIYLVAQSRDHDGELRHFKVDRIEAAEVTNFPFHMPEDFNLSDHFSKSFGVFHGHDDITVRVRFLPPVIRYVSEGKWHESQVLTKERDGSLLAEFNLSHTEEIKRWIMSFGKNSIVLEPESLRNEIVEEFHSLLATYAKGTKRTYR